MPTKPKVHRWNMNTGHTQCGQKNPGLISMTKPTLNKSLDDCKLVWPVLMPSENIGPGVSGQPLAGIGRIELLESTGIIRAIPAPSAVRPIAIGLIPAQRHFALGTFHCDRLNCWPAVLRITASHSRVLKAMFFP